MIGRFIIECDPEHFDVAKDAILYLQGNREHNEVMTSGEDVSGTISVAMHAKRLKKSIRVRQVKP